MSASLRLAAIFGLVSFVANAALAAGPVLRTEWMQPWTITPEAAKQILLVSNQEAIAPQLQRCL